MPEGLKKVESCGIGLPAVQGIGMYTFYAKMKFMQPRVSVLGST